MYNKESEKLRLLHTVLLISDMKTSLLLLEMDLYTYATIRKLDKSNIPIDVASKENMPIKVLQLDVADDNSVKNTVNQIKEEKRQIDVLVNNPGYIYLIFGRVIYL